jgi:ankyrin repeat protein
MDADKFIRLCEYKTADIIKKILKNKNIDVNSKDKYGCTALIYACSHERVDVVRVLLEASVDPNIQNKWGGFALCIVLHSSQRKNHIKIVRALLKYSVPNGRTSGAWQSTTEQVRANVNLQTDKGYTALMFASTYGNIKCVRLLLKHGADPNIKNNYGVSVLSKAISNQTRKKCFAQTIKLLNKQLFIPMLHKRFTSINENIIRESTMYLLTKNYYNAYS